MTDDSKRKVFLLVSPSEERLDLLTLWVNNHYKKPVIYRANNGYMAFKKFTNAKVDIVVSEIDKRYDSVSTIDSMLHERKNPHLAIILIGEPPDDDRFLDDMVRGKVRLLPDDTDEILFSHALVGALNYSSNDPTATFRMIYLAKGDVLLKEGDKAEHIYILKHGLLDAFHMKDGEKIVLGTVAVGEFVGEMAIINNEPRSAYIEAVQDSELIELPIGLVNKLIYTRPSWAKGILQTLVKRLKQTNKIVTG